MIDSLSKRYGLLPSETMMRANTFDLFIMDAAINYESYMREQNDPNKKSKVSLSQDEMRTMLENVRGQNKGHDDKKHR